MKILLRLLVAGAALLSLRAFAEIAVVVDPAVPLDSISIEQLERLYLNRPDRYPEGVKLVPLDRQAGSEIRKQFVQKVLWKTEVEVAQFWSRRMYSGKGRPPRQLRDDGDVIEEVTANPGDVGYIDADSVSDQVKVLLSIP
jgi:ABC-type phosphate transport system substrate-binding protein